MLNVVRLYKIKKSVWKRQGRGLGILCPPNTRFLLNFLYFLLYFKGLFSVAGYFNPPLSLSRVKVSHRNDPDLIPVIKVNKSQK